MNFATSLIRRSSAYPRLPLESYVVIRIADIQRDAVFVLYLVENSEHLTSVVNDGTARPAVALLNQ